MSGYVVAGPRTPQESRAAANREAGTQVATGDSMNANATIDELKAVCDAARAAARENPTQENIDAAKAAWAALSAASPPVRQWSSRGDRSLAARSGRRQAQEREAQRQEALRRKR